METEFCLKGIEQTARALLTLLTLRRHVRAVGCQLSHLDPCLLCSLGWNVLWRWQLLYMASKSLWMASSFKRGSSGQKPCGFFGTGANFRQYLKLCVFLKLVYQKIFSVIWLNMCERSIFWELKLQPLTCPSCAGIVNIYSLFNVFNMHVQTGISHYTQNLLTKTCIYSVSLRTTVCL